ncbi:SEC14-like protein 5 [Seminavis robusta]|uniref:SEC14-like protein 5 n=1 Tax=Seminavis robusta TaxID=568900 RepID=A0A9N8D9E2_9STRA|nr:SEC14-like protein 5 [Seminavis robusta]|eukprot:Sro7_g006340.1 SEC14-like protein 5 (382) ;mRNA; r:240784-242043
MTSTSMTDMLLPVVEAVPFFRRAKVHVFGVTTTTATKPTKTKTAVKTATRVSGGQQVEEIEDQVEIEEPPQKKQKLQPDQATNKPQYDFPLFPNQANFEKDPNAPIPFRYLDAHQKEGPARKATLESLQWRKQFQIDTILSRPNPNYDVTKAILPHYFIGRSTTTNHVVFIQRPGLANMELAKHNNVQSQDMSLQYAYVFEYCWNIMHPHETAATDPDALMIGILDMQGLHLGLLRKGDLISFVKEFVGMIDAHYPTRGLKTYMINAPQWFNMVWKLVSPIMRESTKEKIVLYSAGDDQDEALLEALGPDMAATVMQALRIPDKKELKNKNKYDLSLTSDILLETEMEQEIRSFVMKRLEQDGIEMKPVLSLADPKPTESS